MLYIQNHAGSHQNLQIHNFQGHFLIKNQLMILFHMVLSLHQMSFYLLLSQFEKKKGQGVKYLVFVSSRSVKTRELSFAQFVYFLRKVSIFQFFHSKIEKKKKKKLSSKSIQTEQSYVLSF